jgi:hypothetical protein
VETILEENNEHDRNSDLSNQDLREQKNTHSSEKQKRYVTSVSKETQRKHDFKNNIPCDPKAEAVQKERKRYQDAASIT